MNEQHRARSHRGLHATLIALLCWNVASCQRSDGPPPTLDNLALGSEVKESGLRLISLPEGMHRLDTSTENSPDVVIAIHGHGSHGYEWVYPLKKLGERGTRVFFYRWNWNQCPQSAAKGLQSSLRTIIRSQTNVGRIRIVAHSYGGIISALVGQSYKDTLPLEINIVASPLAGLPRLSAGCNFDGFQPTNLPSIVSWHQWRTRHHLDGAFKDLKTDPQIVAIPGGKVVELPETYRNKRLGHNWSISWVAEQIMDSPPQ